MDVKVHRLLGSHALAAVAMSLPWPWLLVLVWDHTHDPGLLGLTAASRMVPYVACSWWVARIGDRHQRDAVIRGTVVARLVLLAGVPLAVRADLVALAIVLATLAVAAATPAYPALAASMPDAAGPDRERATDVLVTIEVASFVVGPAFGGVLLAVPDLIAPLSLLGTGAALGLLAGVRLAPAAATASATGAGMWAELRRSAPIRRSLFFMAVLNLVLAAVGVSLVLLARGEWTGWWTPDTAYGVASGALGFGALAAPALARCGRDACRRARIGVLLLGTAVLVVAVSPTVLYALLALLLAGAAAVHAESAATNVIQAEARDGVRASLFGLADACMVGAAMVGALVTPSVAARVGPGPLLATLAAGALASAPVVIGAREMTPRPTQLRPTTTVPASSSSVSMLVSNPAETNSTAVRSA
jgi:hypothetical protein